jgi:hypothetical protein
MKPASRAPTSGNSAVYGQGPGCPSRAPATSGAAGESETSPVAGESGGGWDRAALVALLLFRFRALAGLNQRIVLRYHLDGMELAKTAAYVAHHLQLAGRSDRMFSDDAVALMHHTARGLPRAINNLATQALVAAFAHD